MPTLGPQQLDATRRYLLELRDEAGAVAVMSGTEPLAATIGGATPGGPVAHPAAAWSDPAAGRLILTITPADLAGFAVGEWPVDLKVQVAGAWLDALDGTIALQAPAVAPAPGPKDEDAFTEIARLLWDTGEFADLVTAAERREPYDLPAAIVEDLADPRDEWIEAGTILHTERFVLTLRIADDPTDPRFSTMQRLVRVAHRALDGQSLAGFTDGFRTQLEAFTRVSRGRRPGQVRGPAELADPNILERMLEGTFGYELPNGVDDYDVGPTG